MQFDCVTLFENQKHKKTVIVYWGEKKFWWQMAKTKGNQLVLLKILVFDHRLE